MITEQQRIERRQWIGASDVPKILGLSQFATPADVWAEKTGRLDPAEAGAAAEAGNRFEGAVLDFAGESLGDLARNVHLPADGLSFPLHSNLDAQVRGTGNPVEAKTAGLFGPLTKDWGEDGGDQVPDVHLVQCNVHLLVTKKEVCHLPAFLGGRGFCMFHIDRSPTLIAAIIERCEAFWRHVQTDTPPEGSFTLNVAKAIHRQPGKTISIPKTVGERYLQARAAKAAAEKECEAAQAALMTAMGDAEVGEVVDGIVRVVAFEAKKIERAAYTVKAGEYTKLTVKEGAGL